MLLLLHEGSGTHDRGAPALLDQRARWPDLQVVTCGTPEELAERARAAVEHGERTLFAGGGDGTVSLAVNAVRDRLATVRIGVVPLGTGNDFARTLGLPIDPVEALDLQVRARSDRSVDLVRVTAGDRSILCVNHVSGGLGGRIEEVVDDATKRRWRRLAYARAGAVAALEHPAWDLSFEADDGPTEERRVVSVLVANGRTAGGGFPVAPDADPQDRRLDLVLVDDGSPLDLAAVAARLLGGDYTESEGVHARRVRTVTLRASPPMPLSIDGEPWCHTPARLEIVPGALRVPRIG